MDFIIMDLEWNNTYARKTKGFINEIIEIGAVKLDENLNFKDKFSCLVRPQIGKKLRGSVKELTNITNEEVRSGEPFTKVFSSFRRWIARSAYCSHGVTEISVCSSTITNILTVSIQSRF